MKNLLWSLNTPNYHQNKSTMYEGRGEGELTIQSVSTKNDTFIKYFLSLLDQNCTSKNLYILKEWLVLIYSAFYRISFGYLHPEIQSFKEREVKTQMVQFENNHPCIHTVYNGERWTISLVFTSLYKRDVVLDVGHQLRWGEKHFIQKWSLFKGIQLLLVTFALDFVLSYFRSVSLFLIHPV